MTTRTAPDAGQEMLRSLIEGAMARLLVPGVVVGITDGGEEIILPFGVTNVEHPLPVDAATLFHIGSTTKTMTGTILMLLVEAGTVDLDAPVRHYLPEFRLADEDAASRATVKHLLTHTGGWEGDVFADPSRGDDALALMLPLLADRPQITPLGEIWSYNNASFYVAGLIIERLTGQPYEVAARELLLDPLGMEHSFFVEEDVMTRRFAVGHEVEDGKLVVTRSWQLPRSVNAVGRLTSTASDQLRYARFHMGDGTAPDGTRLLSSESLQLMRTPVTTADNGSQMGLTWFLKEIGGLLTVSHGGSTSGQMSEFLMVPERNFAVTVLTNGEYGHTLGREVIAWALRAYLGIEEPVSELLPIDAASLAEYAGTYDRPDSRAELTVAGDRLVLQTRQTRSDTGEPIPPPPPPVKAGLFAPDRLIVVEDPFTGMQGEFLRGPRGEIQWLRLGKRIYARQT